MGQMITRGKELIRINPSNKQKIEYSTTDGRSWSTRYSGSSCGDFNDLNDNGKEILGMTSKGLYYSLTGEVGAREAKKKKLCKSGASTAFTFVQIFKVKLNNHSFS